jgi:hypothetical protein
MEIRFENPEQVMKNIKVSQDGTTMILSFNQEFKAIFSDFNTYYTFIGLLNRVILHMKICIECGKLIKEDYTGNYCNECYLEEKLKESEENEDKR